MKLSAAQDFVSVAFQQLHTQLLVQLPFQIFVFNVCFFRLGFMSPSLICIVLLARSQLFILAAFIKIYRLRGLAGKKNDNTNFAKDTLAFSSLLRVVQAIIPVLAHRSFSFFFSFFPGVSVPKRFYSRNSLPLARRYRNDKFLLATQLGIASVW